MATKTFDPVRGSAVRITGLNDDGSIPTPVRAVSTKAVAAVRITAITEPESVTEGRDEHGSLRLRTRSSEQTVGYMVDVDFMGVQPAALHLMANVPMVLDAHGNVVGIDAVTSPMRSTVGLEVWSKVTAPGLVGYTVFPGLRGGQLSGFSVSSGLASFRVLGARVLKVPKWGKGPYNDIEHDAFPLHTPVSRNLAWRSILVEGSPPPISQGIEEFAPPIEFGNIIFGGSAQYTSDFVILGGNAQTSSPDTINGGTA